MRIKAVLLVSCSLLMINLQSISQTAEDSVKTAVNNLFSAMKNADTAQLRNCFSGNCIFQTITKNKEKNTVVKDEMLGEFLASVIAQPKGSLDERIVFDVVKIDGPLAIVWTPYKFYYNGKFLHCGVNSFQLVKLAEGWKIQYLIDTRRKENCGE